ncbi:DegT/DnrJ/EryC1/StrS family aminotransferase [Candidatus Pelagibacter ubique]|jgi:dTDP-4-amino-4,6-dideoxygalactose transaminase|nr:DegT/DnrJ/EryC1/StrS family aminotransferase [Candidatus Pelagibacter ubique]
MKIDWSGRPHEFTNKDVKYLTNIIKKADPLTQGKYLKKFESDFSKYIKKKNTFAVSSAASALEIIAALLQIKKNDEIILPAHTYCASAIPFARNKAKLIWADIDFKSRTIDLNDFKKKVTKKTKAVIIVHLYGYAVDFKNILGFCKKRKIKVIEDCAQALGAEVNNKKIGTLGDFSCYSFHAQKNITTLGEGGMLYVKSIKDAKKVPGLRHNGHSPFNFKRKEYWKPAMGNVDSDIRGQWPFKFTLTEVQCGAGILMLKKLDKMNNIRIKRANNIVKFLSNFKELDFFNPKEKKRHVYHLLSAYFQPKKNITRDDLIQLLYEKYKIKCVIQYYPLYKYDLFKKNGFGKAKCPNTEKFYNNMISFPFHVWMSKQKFRYLKSSIKKSLIELQNKK